MTKIPENTKEEESQSPAANKTSSKEDKCDEDMSWSEQELRQLFKLVRSRGLKELLEGNKPEPTKRLSVVCKLCNFVADRVEDEGSLCQKCLQTALIRQQNFSDCCLNFLNLFRQHLSKICVV